MAATGHSRISNFDTGRPRPGGEVIGTPLIVGKNQASGGDAPGISANDKNPDAQGRGRREIGDQPMNEQMYSQMPDATSISKPDLAGTSK